jgi:hypothetical protein
MGMGNSYFRGFTHPTLRAPLLGATVYTQVCPEQFSTEVTAATARNSNAG